VVAVAASAGTAGAAGGGSHVMPNRLGEIDCNGFSPIQKSVKPTLLCADPSLPGPSRLEDHDHYIGHDEPSIRFLSSRPGSGNDVTFVETLGKDPRAMPTTGATAKRTPTISSGEAPLLTATSAARTYA